MEGSEPNKTWPLPAFYFAVKIHGETIVVGEVSGLSATLDAGNVSPGNIVLKRGVFVEDLGLWRIFDNAATNGAAWDITIDLLDESGAAMRRWTLHDARAVKYTGPELRSDGNEVAVEQLEIAGGRMTVTIPDSSG